MTVLVGQTVKWSNARNNLGVVIKCFDHKGLEYAIVENSKGVLSVVRVYENLIVCHEPQ